MKDQKPKAVTPAEIIPASKAQPITTDDAAAFDRQFTAGHQVDEELIEMIRTSAKAELPHDGFVSALHEHDRSLQIDRVVIYAWGTSAGILAEQLKLRSKQPTRRLKP